MTEPIHRQVLFATSLFSLACSGLDPGSFGPTGAPSGVAAQAGYSFDAGTSEPGVPGGSAGTSSATRANAGRGSAPATAQGGSAGMGDGGEPDNGAGGTTNDVEDTEGDGGERGGGGGRPSGGEAGSHGGTASVGGSAAGYGAVGGEGGAPGGAHGGGFAGVDAGLGGSGIGLGGSDAVGGAGTGFGGGGATARALRFGEYVEGSGSYKALEITAARDSALDGCRIVTYSNGALTGSGISLVGVVATSGAYTLCSSTLSPVLGAVCDRTTNLSMNGNDAVVLECDGAVMDSIGQIGFDPGTAWIGASGSTVNTTLRIRCETDPDVDPTDAFDPDARWLALPVDTFDGLGDPSCG